MPSRNRVKLYAPNTYYHVYNRGVAGQEIFKDPRDYAVVLGLFKRYLSGKEARDPSGRIYEDLSAVVRLSAYCLMPNHVHLLLYQIGPHGMTTLIRRVFGAYSVYFNKKYGRFGPLFQDRYKAAMISSEPYLWHISRYIHLNPMDLIPDPLKYKFSSYSYYEGAKQATWLDVERILSLHTHGSYRQFVLDGQDRPLNLEETEAMLANG